MFYPYGSPKNLLHHFDGFRITVFEFQAKQYAIGPFRLFCHWKDPKTKKIYEFIHAAREPRHNVDNCDLQGICKGILFTLIPRRSNSIGRSNTSTGVCSHPRINVCYFLVWSYKYFLVLLTIQCNSPSLIQRLLEIQCFFLIGGFGKNPSKPQQKIFFV